MHKPTDFKTVQVRKQPLSEKKIIKKLFKKTLSVPKTAPLTASKIKNTLFELKTKFNIKVKDSSSIKKPRINSAVEP